MCKAFSCVVTEAEEVFWKAGTDSHEDIIEEFKLKKLDKKEDFLNDGLCRVEITPENDNYLMPEGKWIFNFDTPKPKWWNKKYQDSCYVELYKWQSEIYSKINMEEAKNLIHPFKIKPPKITEEHLLLLKNWASAWDSVRASAWDSAWDSVCNSVGDSVYSYVGSLFIISNWKYCDNADFKYEGYPFQPCVDLWKMGLVPSFDGKIWRLHGSKNGGKDAKVLWEGKI